VTPGAEARLFGRYVLGRAVSDEVVRLYESGPQTVVSEGADVDAAVVGFALRRPWSIGALDGALALARPRALLRRKLLLVTAILETQPEYCSDFLPADRPLWRGVAVAFAVLRAALQTGAGLLLLRFIR
jgi:hypothetical protein